MVHPIPYHPIGEPCAIAHHHPPPSREPMRPQPMPTPATSPPFFEVGKIFPFFPSIATTDPFLLSPQSYDPQTPWSDSLYYPTRPSIAVSL
ncbi:hypothetical protein L484_022729 [Morus notabilis]|uniref:Uncharacterized protein n=1 Tax=Morus notabilis TaxID=981085 RepID=W9T0F4_9ROSA|nr:hypothetical protein L484_022729 [Morus notabilis]